MLSDIKISLKQLLAGLISDCICIFLLWAGRFLYVAAADKHLWRGTTDWRWAGAISAVTPTSGRASSHSYPQGHQRVEPQTSHNSLTACPRLLSPISQRQTTWRRPPRGQDQRGETKGSRAVYSKRRCDKFWQRTEKLWLSEARRVIKRTKIWQNFGLEERAVIRVQLPTPGTTEGVWSFGTTPNHQHHHNNNTPTAADSQSGVCMINTTHQVRRESISTNCTQVSRAEGLNLAV